MAAPKGNTFGLKWTLEEIEKKVYELYYALTDKDHARFKEFEKIIYLGEALTMIDLYRQAWDYFAKVLQKPIGCKEEDESNDTKERREKVFNTIKKVEDMMQARLVSRTLNRKTSTPMAIFVLKNQGWTDRQEHDHTSKGEKIDGFTGSLNVRVINSNEKIEIDEQGNIIKDLTDED